MWMVAEIKQVVVISMQISHNVIKLLETYMPVLI